MAASEPVPATIDGPVRRVVAAAGLTGGIASAEIARPLEAADVERGALPVSGVGATAEETALVAEATPRVRSMFVAGRACAHRALAAIGAEFEPLLRAGAGASGADRAPAWPAGFTGSIAHTPAHCAAIAARTTTHAAVGLDLESVSRVTPRLLDRICTVSERSAIAKRTDPAWQALHFAAREAFYKAWSPRTRRPIGFRDVEVVVHDATRFEVRVRSGLDVAPFRRATFAGTWAAEADLIVALVTVPAG